VIELVLYGRPGCHLCDDARGVLQRIGAPFTEIDIETDDDLHRRYLERIPVLTVDGEETYDFFIDEPDLLRRLGRVGPA
jgi:glutaredoxin